MIERKGELIRQICPYREGPCIDTCPKMMEPFKKINAKGYTKAFILNICDGYSLEFEIFEDFRGVRDENE